MGKPSISEFLARAFGIDIFHKKTKSERFASIEIWGMEDFEAQQLFEELCRLRREGRLNSKSQESSNRPTNPEETDG